MIYDTELETALKNMKNNTGCFQTYENEEYGGLWKVYSVKILRGTEVQINDDKFNITLGIQKVLVDWSYNTIK